LGGTHAEGAGHPDKLNGIKSIHTKTAIFVKIHTLFNENINKLHQDTE